MARLVDHQTLQDVLERVENRGVNSASLNASHSGLDQLKDSAKAHEVVGDIRGVYDRQIVPCQGH